MKEKGNAEYFEAVLGYQKVVLSLSISEHDVKRLNEALEKVVQAVENKYDS